jgi:alpha-galactosidase
MLRNGNIVIAACLLTMLPVLPNPETGTNYTVSRMNPTQTDTTQTRLSIVASPLSGKLDSDGFPTRQAWEKAAALRFDQDWQGENSAPERGTEVRLLWTPETLYIQFRCRYRSITVFDDARADGWRDKLWERDVAETFLQPDASDPWVYREFEVSPKSQWIDLAISHRNGQELHSGLQRRVKLDEKQRVWTAELAIPMKSLTTNFDPRVAWRANFYRIEGENEPRFYGAWSPTHSAKPNFHVPAAFGTLQFQE